MLNFLYCTLCFLVFLPTISNGETWNENNDRPGFWIKGDAKFTSKETPKRNFPYSAIRFDRTKFSYELIDMSDLFFERYPEITQDSIVFDDKTQSSRIVKPSMAEAWQILRHDRSVEALVPFGFAEVAGDARIAGLRKSDGVLSQGIFTAPNLDTAFCLDDADLHEKRKEAGKPRYPGQVPFIFPIKFNKKVSYRYSDDFEQIDMSANGKPRRFKETFDACKDIVQLGYMVISPRDIGTDKDSFGRISQGKSSVAKLKAFERIVMLYDRFGLLNFVRTDAPSQIHDLGLLVSSSEYYDNEKCAYREPRSYPKRSRSCELWAVTVSAYDDAAIVIRNSTNVDVSPIFWGDPKNTTPAVLIIRSKSILAQTKIEAKEQEQIKKSAP